MMIPSNGSPKSSDRRRKLTVFFTILLLVSMACSVFERGQESETEAPAVQVDVEQPTAMPTIEPSPTPPPAPLPPALVEAAPISGSTIALNGALTFYFNQPMQRASVEAALSGEPQLSGSLTWADDATLTYTPDQPLPPDTTLTITIAATAQAQNGMAMLAPVSLSYQTSSFLEVSQTLPEPGKVGVSTTSAIVAAFNQPVTTLGADPASLPDGFSLEPEAPGRGEWINTSTYIFYPEPGLAGGMEYTAQVNPALVSTNGSPLGAETSWSFRTNTPRMVTLEPGEGIIDARLDAVISMTFNMRMDAASVEANFSMTDGDGAAVAGEFDWNEDFTNLVYTPTAQLARNTEYTVRLEPEAAAAGGTPTNTPYQSTWYTVPELSVIGSSPPQGGSISMYESIRIDFSSYIDEEALEDYISVSPEVGQIYPWKESNGKSIYFHLYGVFQPDTAYTVTLSGELTDAWGSALGDDFILNFRTTPPEPNLSFPYGTDSIFLTTEDSGVMAFATNLASMPMTVGEMTLNDFFAMFRENGYELRQSYVPEDPVSWTQQVNAPRNETITTTVPLAPDQQPVAPGIYHMRVNPPIDYPPGPLLVAVSNYQTVLKTGVEQAFVWAVDLRSDQPATGLPVSIYDEFGQLLASGMTGADGTFTDSIPGARNFYSPIFAVLGTPGEDDFGLAMNNWSDGVSPWDFELSGDYYQPGMKVYLYTDRPIYRPGQTVYFRAVVREAYNGRYTLPDRGSYSLKLFDGIGQQLETYDLPLSAFGSGYDEYLLPEDAQPGYYTLSNDEDQAYLYFQVAEYRKPEINLQVSMAEEQILAGEALVAQVSARYFFDVPVGGLRVHWALYAQDTYFNVPGNYQSGPYDTGWLEAFHYPYMGEGLGRPVDDGEAVTDAEGLLTLELPTEENPARQLYTLEVTASDESGLPVSARDNAYANPADFYIGVHPDAWSGEAGEESGFDVLTVDWEGQPSGNHNLKALFQKVEWIRTNPPIEEATYSGPEFERVVTTIASSDFTTGADGMARVAFTPSEPGTYQLDVSGDGTTTQVLTWIGGSGSASWPDLPNQRLRLTADAEAYQPGDTATVFIPNPFNAPALALMTIERSIVMRHEVVEVQAGGLSYNLPLGEEDAPNVYLAVTLLGPDSQGRDDFRQGYLELIVDPAHLILNVSLVSEPERSGPQEEVTFNLRVTDAAGNPVQGEFSLSLVDLAVLALTDPNAPDIVSAFYGEQPIGVRTGISLAASGQRLRYMPGGLGGGGGDEGPSVVREDFPDTAYWNPEIVTDENGEASLTVRLPDSLTTWQVTARGMTSDTLTGESQLNLVTTKEVLVRPVTPRFLVAGDHAQMAAVVNNNTNNEVQAEVSLQSNGFTLDEIATASQVITVPANGRGRVEWWGTADAVESADLLFSVTASGPANSTYRDAVRVAEGALPILHYTTPQTFATAGVMDAAGERLELVSLPATFEASQGQLQVELASSVAGVIVETLDVLDDLRYDCNEQVLSSFYPNLQTYLVLQSFGIEAPVLEMRLESSLQEGVKTLTARQNEDGGWGWWPGDDTDLTITAYVLLGLSTAQQAGIAVPDEVIEGAVNALYAGMIAPSMATQPWQLNQLAFMNYALSQANSADPALANQLFDVRDQLDPWAQGLLALTLEDLNPGNEETDILVSDLQSTAIRSATGVHWEQAAPDYYNLISPVTNNAMVIYALAQLEPASTLLPDAVNYHIASRMPYGGWGSTYDDAWTVLAMSMYMQGSGELNSSYTFGALLNGTAIASGTAGGETQFTPVTSTQPISSLYPEDPNALLIQRTEGGGRLYYNASLQVYQPVAQAQALNRGISVSRAYYPAGADLKSATPIQSAQKGEAVTVRLTLVLPNEAYYLVLEDYIPAGAEILDTSLKTVQQDEYGEPGPLYDPDDPYSSGWGWWLFEPARIYDERIAFTASYLPAGTYELTYTMMPLQPGEYQMLPATSWMFYFPEVQGSSTGEIFEIKP